MQPPVIRMTWVSRRLDVGIITDAGGGSEVGGPNTTKSTATIDLETYRSAVLDMATFSPPRPFSSLMWSRSFDIRRSSERLSRFGARLWCIRQAIAE